MKSISNYRNKGKSNLLAYWLGNVYYVPHPVYKLPAAWNLTLWMFNKGESNVAMHCETSLIHLPADHPFKKYTHCSIYMSMFMMCETPVSMQMLGHHLVKIKAPLRQFFIYTTSQTTFYQQLALYGSDTMELKT